VAIGASSIESDVPGQLTDVRHHPLSRVDERGSDCESARQVWYASRPMGPLVSFVLAQVITPVAWPGAPVVPYEVTAGPAIACDAATDRCVVLWADSRFGAFDGRTSSLWVSDLAPGSTNLGRAFVVSLDGGAFPDLSVVSFDGGALGLVSRPGGTLATVAFPTLARDHFAGQFTVRATNMKPGTACLAQSGAKTLFAFSSMAGAQSFVGDTFGSFMPVSLATPLLSMLPVSCATSTGGFALGYGTSAPVSVLASVSESGNPTSVPISGMVDELLPVPPTATQLLFERRGTTVAYRRSEPAGWPPLGLPLPEPHSRPDTRLVVAGSNGFGVVAMSIFDGGVGSTTARVVEPTTAPVQGSSVAGHSRGLAERRPGLLVWTTQSPAGTVMNQLELMPGSVMFMPRQPQFIAPAAQSAPSLAWDSAGRHFLVLWDEGSDAGVVSWRGALHLDGGLTALGPARLVTASSGGKARLFPTFDGGLATWFVGPGGGGVLQVGSDPSEPFPYDRAAYGQAVRVDWTVLDAAFRVGTQTKNFFEARGPECVARRAGALVALVFDGTSTEQVFHVLDQPNAAPSIFSSGPSSDPPPEAPFAACTVPVPGPNRTGEVAAVFPSLNGIELRVLAASDGGRRLSSVVDALDPGRTAKGPVLATALGRELLVVYSDGPVGAEGISLRAATVNAADGGRTALRTLATNEAGLRSVTVASTPLGEFAAVAWQTFDLDAGAWVIRASVLEAEPVDGGVDDGGQVALDAGLDAGESPTDAGAMDGGATPDAGARDAGAMADAGAPDAGAPLDGGASDAGPPAPAIIFVPACGCSGTPWPFALVVAAWLVRRRWFSARARTGR
jgi:hypothetical protein